MKSHKMKHRLLLNFTSIVLFLIVSKSDAFREGGICSWSVYEENACFRSDFPCVDGSCVPRHLYCDGKRDCSDGSDEEFCDIPIFAKCPTVPPMEECPGSKKCVLKEWLCDGLEDCEGGSDEFCDELKDDEYSVKLKALDWLRKQRKSQASTDVWGRAVDKLAVVFFLSSTTQDENIRKEMAYELSIQLLSRLSQKKLRDIPSHDLASYVNAFLVTCLNPRKFHGLDLVQELRSRVDSQNYTNPYLLLSLCNAGETITELDKLKLIDIFSTTRRTFWTDIQAFAVMALACAHKQTSNDTDYEDLQQLTLELKKHQYTNGSVENLQTTALVMQALLSAEPDSDTYNFDEMKALRHMKAMQKADGSFGSFLNTYFILPVLNCKSLIDINSNHCQMNHNDVTSTLEDLTSVREPKIRVRYSIWVGLESDLERNLVLRVPANMSFYRIMEIAANSDPRYRFEYVVYNHKPYVTALSGLQDDPEKGIFWFLYSVEEGKPPYLAQESPADVVPKDNDHFVMWYRSGTWVD